MQYQPLLRDENWSRKSKLSTILLFVACLLAAFVAGYFEGKNDVFERLSNSSEEMSLGVSNCNSEVSVDSRELTPEQKRTLMLSAGIRKDSDQNPAKHDKPLEDKANGDQFTKEVAMDVCSKSDQDDLSLYWLMEYFVKWGTHPLVALNQGHEQILSNLKKDGIACCAEGSKEPCQFDIRELAEALKLDVQKNAKDEAIKFIIQRAMTKHISHAADDALNLIVAAGMTESCVWGHQRLPNGRFGNVVIREADKTGLLKAGHAGKAVLNEEGTFVKTAALNLLEKSPTLAGSQITKKAVTALANPVVGIAEAVAEVATESILSALGVDDPRIVAAAKGGIGILTAIGVGGMIGGPIGAAAGGAVGAASFLTGEVVSAVMRTGHGPEDNWCYAKIGELDHDAAGGITFFTYAGDDAWNWKDYGKVELNSGDADYFSAGQAQDGFFQVKIWDEHGNFVMHFPKVYYRDMFYISRIDKTLVVVLGRGGYAVDSAGKIERFEFPKQKR